MSKYVMCPDEFEPLFQMAEDILVPVFEDRQWDPDRGSTLVTGERYVMYRGASMAVALKSQLDQVLGSGAGTVIYQFGKACGSADALFYFKKLGVQDPALRLALGPVGFALGGYAVVKILPDSAPAPNDDYILVYDHPNSYEAEAHMATGVVSRTPVDFLNAGYSAGWCSEAFGIKLDAKEITCLAMGDPQCRFVMAPPSRLRERVQEISAKYSLR